MLCLNVAEYMHNIAIKCLSNLLQLNDYSLVRFLPMDISDEDSISDLLFYIDNTIQYGEDLDVKVPRVSEICFGGGGASAL